METVFSSLNLPEAEFLYFIETSIRNPVLTAFFNVITFLGEKGAFPILLAFVLVFFRKTRKTAATFGFSLAFDYLIVNIIMKNLFARPRPFWPEILGAKLTTATWFDFMIPDSFSFPSGHTACLFTVAIAAWFACSKKRDAILLTVLAFLVALSRLYLGVHYPTDVLFGAIFGSIAAILGVITVRAIRKTKFADFVNGIIPDFF